MRIGNIYIIYMVITSAIDTSTRLRTTYHPITTDQNGIVSLKIYIVHWNTKF